MKGRKREVEEECYAMFGPPRELYRSLRPEKSHGLQRSAENACKRMYDARFGRILKPGEGKTPEFTRDPDTGIIIRVV